MQSRSLHIRPLYSKKTRVRPSPIAGYGVFAEENIEAGATVEEIPFLYIPKEHPQTIGDVIFETDKKDLYLLALGNGSLYNHSDDYNLDRYFDYKAEIVVFKANRNIEKDQELTIFYSKEWFETRNLKPETHDANYRAPKDNSDLFEKRFHHIMRLLAICFISFVIVYWINHL